MADKQSINSRLMNSRLSGQGILLAISAYIHIVLMFMAIDITGVITDTSFHCYANSRDDGTLN